MSSGCASMSQDDRMDAVVIGSGPSGLSAALYLLENGFHVAVVDRFTDAGFSRYHSICGAGISEETFRRLEYIEATDILNRIDRAELVFPGDVTIGMKVRGFVLDRVAFLDRLKRRCMELGGSFITGEVASIEHDEGYVVRTRHDSIQCRYLIGCDGAHSIVRKLLFHTRPSMVPVDEFIIEGGSEPVYRIILGERYKGLYEWSFPAGENRCVGSGKGIIRPESISHGSRDIPFGGVPAISDDGAFLCGDAAGMANPVSYGGLRTALLSGQQAAREIVEKTEGSYQRWWDGSIYSSPRFMGFRNTLMDWTDEDLIRSSRLFKNGRGIYLWGAIAGIIHPKYIPMYIGCLKTFRHGW